MKFLHKTGLILAVMALLIASGCSELDYQPKDAIDADQAINDVASVNAAVLGAYSELQDGDLAFDGFLSSTQYFSDEAIHTGTFPTRAEFGRLDVFPANTTMAAFFSDFYDVINICNTGIFYIPEVEDPALTPEPFIAELRFIRAFCYWYLTNNFGDVPLITEPTFPEQTGTELNVTRTPKADVYAQILADLEYAEANLPAVQQGGVRVGSMAAKAMLARYYLFVGDYANARTKAEEVINSGLFGLATTFESIFNGTSTSERIWYLDFTAVDANSNAFFYYPAALGGRLSISPSPQLVAAYDSTDLRAAVTTVPFGNSVFCNKYQDISGGTDPLYFIRLSEMYLIAAEAAAEQGEYDVAEGYLSPLRARAGLEDVEIDESNYVDVVLTEKFKELACEGPYRLWDLRRRGLAESVLGPLGYTPGLDEVWPIPTREIDRNPNMTQNPGY